MIYSYNFTWKSSAVSLKFKPKTIPFIINRYYFVLLDLGGYELTFIFPSCMVFS